MDINISDVTWATRGFCATAEPFVILHFECCTETEFCDRW